MTNSNAIVYGIAAVFGIVWVLFFLANIKRIINFAIQTTVGVVTTLLGCLFAILALVLFGGAIWFTVAPVFYPSITIPFSQKHFLGMIIDWSLALLCLAL